MAHTLWRSRLLFSLGLSWMYFMPAVSSQGTKEAYQDSISYYQAQDNLQMFFSAIRSYSTAYLKEAYADSVMTKEETSEFYAVVGKLLQPQRNLSAAERVSLRKACMGVAYNIIMSLGRYDVALDYYLRAHAYVDDDDCLDPLAWYIENQISFIYAQLGDYEKAIDFGLKTERSLIYYERYDLLSRLYTNLGYYYFWTRKYADAGQYYTKGLALANEQKYGRGMQANLSKLAELYLTEGKTDQAEQALRQANDVLDTIQEYQGKSIARAEMENHSASVFLEQGKYNDALLAMRNSLRCFDHAYASGHRRESAKVYARMAETYLKMQAADSAHTAIVQGLRTLNPQFDPAERHVDVSQMYPENTIVDLFRLRAQYFLLKHKDEEPDTIIRNMALECIEAALQMNDQLREQILADPSKLLSIEENKNLIDEAIRLVYQQYNETNDLRYFAKARKMFSRSKALLLGEKSKENQLLGIVSALDRERLLKIKYQLSSFAGSLYNTDKHDEDVRSDILVLQQEAKLILDAYRGKELKVVRHRQYLEYNMQDNDIYVLAEIQGKVYFLLLGTRAQFSSMLKALNQFILSKGLESDDRILYTMFDFLVRPLVHQWPEKITIIPDGDICLIPFEVLKSPDGAYGLERAKISYDFQYERYAASSKKNTSSGLVCLAPEYPDHPDAMAIHRGSTYHLPFVKEELEGIREIYGDKVQVFTTAAKSNWLTALKAADIFHFAGHAIVQEDRAYLALMKEGNVEEWSANEIASLHQPLEMVVLSACETGIGEQEYGEGLRSLGKSFMEAGAASTIFSLWTVNDKSTATIMKRLYHHLHAGLDKDEALRQAKLDYLQETSKSGRHPYYWAAFIAAGDMKGITSARYPFLLWGSVILLSILGLGIFWVKKKGK